MSLDNRLVALCYRIIFVILCAAGIYVSLFENGDFNASALIFYTMQSNLLCLVVMIMVIGDTVYKIRDSGIRGYNSAFPRLKGATTMVIAVTFLVFHFLLRPILFEAGMEDYAASFANIAVHYITPILFILDWLMFDKKGVYSRYDPLLWESFPLAYFIFAVIRAQVGGVIPQVGSRYPYFFIDIDAYGGMVALYVLGMAVFFIALGYVIVLIDRIYYDNGFKLKKWEEEV